MVQVDCKNAPEGADQGNVAALKRLIVEQRKCGWTVSLHMSGKEYVWNDELYCDSVWLPWTCQAICVCGGSAATAMWM